MAKALDRFVIGWVVLQVAVNLLALYFVGDDGASCYGVCMFGSGLALLGSQRAMLVHAGYLVGNLIFVLPILGARLWRDRIVGAAG